MQAFRRAYLRWVGRLIRAELEHVGRVLGDLKGVHRHLPLTYTQMMSVCVCVCEREKERVGEREVGVKIDRWMDKYRMVNLRGRVYVLDKDK